ncbi:type II secretion system minor pseudopilin GspI [Limnohabitans sp.]|uniref:type II secretion system minor pseudopilin GspI n=1 Tax=Limnohabitans sp. TaxID=1907725 RepID=UPI0038BD3912
MTRQRTCVRALHPAKGFTLIEVLVALAIVALALMTGMKVSGALVFNAQRQTGVLLAQICADNAIHQLRLSQQLPGVGETRVPCVQAERNLEVALTVRSTPNPSFRRVDAQVFDAQTPILRVATVLGRY